MTGAGRRRVAKAAAGGRLPAAGSYVQTSRHRRFPGRGHRRSAGDGERGIPHPPPVRCPRCGGGRAGAARQGHRRRQQRHRPQPRRRPQGTGRQVRGDLRGPPADAPGCPLPQRAGGDDPPAALLARVCRQPQACGSMPRFSRRSRAGTWATSSTSRSGCCGICSGAAAKSSPTSPRRCWCWPTTSPPARRPTSTAASSAALSPRSAARAAIRRSWPGPGDSGRGRHGALS